VRDFWCYEDYSFERSSPTGTLANAGGLNVSNHVSFRASQ